MTFKVLQIGKYFYPEKGGIETVTRDVSVGLSLHGVTADVLCFSRSAFVEDQFPFKVYRASSDFEIFNKSFSLEYIRQIRALHADYDVALVHLPNPVAMFALRAFWKKPLVLLWHSDIVTYPQIGRLLRSAERGLIRQSQAVISPTPSHTAGSYLANEMQSKVAVGAYPFDPRRLHQNTDDRCIPETVATFLRGRKLILAVGRLVPYKGYDVLLDAAGSMPDEAAICIVGTGPLDDILRQKIEQLGLGNTVFLAGSIEDGQLAALYSHAHAVVMPSVTRAEMYGMTQVEAMSFGTPIISTSLSMSGVSWVNKDQISGLIVPPGDALALSAAINRLFSDRGLHERLSVGALDLFKRNHDLKAAAARYALILQNSIDVKKA